MIQQIMVYGIAVAAVLSVAALGLERLAALHGRPRRGAWILALLLSVLLPLLMIQRAEPGRTAAPVLEQAPATRPEPIVAQMPAPRHADSVPITAQPAVRQPEPQPLLQPVTPAREWHLPQLSDRSLLQIWAIASLLSGLYLVGAHLRLRRQIAGWQRATLQGRPVLISESMGPALVGVFRPHMVVPRWLLDEPATTQCLILEHERQHIGARDPLLIRAAVVLLAALPWNLPLWWQWRRMRQAIELDCDARVLRTGAQPQSYGEVLLSITGRATRMPSGVVAMSEPVSALERRIQNLLPDPVRYAALQAAGAIALLAAGVGAAIAMDAPVLPARAPLQIVSAPVVAATQPALASPMAIEVMPPAAPLAAVLAAAAAAPAVRADGTQPGPIAPASTTPNDGGMSPRDMALRAAVQRYPELINGPTQSGPYTVTVVLHADGTVYRASLVNLNIIPSNQLERMDVVTGGAAATYGSGAMAGVVNLVLNRRLRGLRLWEADSERAVNDASQTARILQGQQIADVGKASSEFEVFWRVLPADYDESRDAERVTNAVRAKHDDLLFPSRSPRPDIQLLTVFMTEDGQIAREAVELLAEAQYASLNPQPVNGDSLTGVGGSEPYDFYNPPPVPTEAFKVLGLDAGQIGQTGFLRVMPAVPRRASAYPVLVRYAWPRRPGEPIGGKTPAMAAPTAQRTQFVPVAPAPLPQPSAPISTQVLFQVDIPDQVMAAHWTRLPDSYVLRVILDRPANPVRTEVATADKPAPAPAPANGATSTPADRASFFIGNTIANLRGLDPAFGCRTLTLVDGRRAVSGQQPAPARAPSSPTMNQPYPPQYKDLRIDVWLLKADGTQILPATYSCDWTRVDPDKSRPHAEISYGFPLASADQAVAAAIRIEDRYFIQKLQPASKPATR